MSKIKIDKKIVSWKVSNKESQDKIIEVHAPKRPLELPCEIHHANIKGEAWTLLIGLLNGKPYEVIGGLSKNIEIPKKYETGVVIKNPRKTTNSRYDLKFGEKGNEVLIKDISSIFDNPNYESMTRLISMSLRHGVPVQYIVEQLQKDKHSDMFSFSKVIARVLKKYISDGTTSADKCTECSSVNLIYQAGCPVCQDCGHSKCG